LQEKLPNAAAQAFKVLAGIVRFVSGEDEARKHTIDLAGNATPREQEPLGNRSTLIVIDG
jgi:hypothetical protein